MTISFEFEDNVGQIIPDKESKKQKLLHLQVGNQNFTINQKFRTSDKYQYFNLYYLQFKFYSIYLNRTTTSIIL